MPGKGISKSQIDQLDIDQLRNLQKELAVRTVEKTVDRLEELRSAHTALLAKIEKAVAPYNLSARTFLASTRKDVAEFMLERMARNVPDLQVAKPAAAGRPRRQRGRGIVAPKYRHPTNSRLTWTGRGHQPDWITKWLDDDHSRTLKQLRT
ncbi:MAG: H-NS histone family protein [Rhodanobacteraceae bacterium]|nr:MAG: H-NS histone family protein [Rhodanobacteraceae bacterium]